MNRDQIKRKKKRVLLICPQGVAYNYYGVPLGAGYISSWLKKHGHTTLIVSNYKKKPLHDLKKLKDIFSYKLYEHPLHSVKAADIRRILNRFKPDIVGISMTTQVYPYGLEIARIIRRSAPDLPIIAGGFHPSVRPNKVLEDKVFDVVVIDEGEEAMREITESLPDRALLKRIRGIAFIDEKGKTVRTPTRPPRENLDELPFPDKEFITFDGHHVVTKRGDIMTSLGCPFSCSYCSRNSVHGKRVRYRSAENVVAEMEDAKKRYHITCFGLWDDTFGLDKHQARRMSELLIKKKLNVEWDVQSFPWVLDREMLALMKKAGCYKVSLGIQSGNQQILDSIGRPMKVERIIDYCDMVHEVGLEISADFIIGFPQETEESIADTRKLMRRIDSEHLLLNILTPTPGSPLYDQLEKDGKLLSSDMRDYSYSNPTSFRRDHLTVEQLVRHLESMRKEFVGMQKRKSHHLPYLKQQVLGNIRHPTTLLRKARNFCILQLRGV